MPDHGLILTHAYDLQQVRTALGDAGMTALKVVTGWGLSGGWSDDARRAVVALAPQLVVRTVAGDPSYRKGAQRWPSADLVANEIAPWYALKPDLLIELGNEPNVADYGTIYPWEYRWHLLRTIARCHEQFPRARLIAPGLLLDGRDGHAQQRWLEICADAFAEIQRLKGFVAMHVYEHDAFAAAERRHGTTGQVEEAARLYAPYLRRIVSEFGINDGATAPSIKGQRCARFAKANALRADAYFLYHLCADEAVHPQYHLGRLGHQAYGAAL